MHELLKQLRWVSEAVIAGPGARGRVLRVAWMLVASASAIAIGVLALFIGFRDAIVEWLLRFTSCRRRGSPSAIS